MKNFILYFMSVVTLFMSASCSPDKKTIAMTDDPSTTPSDSLSPVESPLYIRLSGKWEGSQVYSLIDTCDISATATPPASKSCLFTVPEAQLYYSDLRFTVGSTVGSSCSIVSFRPYYYQRSNAAAYAAPGFDQPVVCDPSDPKYTIADSVPCYGGAAPKMVDGFPTYVGNYFLKEVMKQTNYDIPSENSTQWYGGGVNYLVANDLPVGPRSVDVVGGDNERVADTFHDYRVLCRDIWGETKYQITLTIQDEDLDEEAAATDPQYDQYTDWN